MTGQCHVPSALYRRERHGIHSTGGWVGPRAGLNRCGKSHPPTGIRFPDRPARSQSLYRLSYPGLHYNGITMGTVHCLRIRTCSKPNYTVRININEKKISTYVQFVVTATNAVRTTLVQATYNNYEIRTLNTKYRSIKTNSASENKNWKHLRKG